MADVASGLKNSRLVPGLRVRSRQAVLWHRLRPLIAQGDAARDRGDWREAARLYGLIVEANPSLHGMRVQLGHAYKQLGDFERSGLHYHTVLKLAPGDDDLHLQIGHLEKLKGNVGEAAAYYRKAAELNPDNTDALVEYSGLAVKLGLPSLSSLSVAADQRLAETRDGPGQVSPVAAVPARRTVAADIGSVQDPLESEPNRAATSGAEKDFLSGGPRPKVLYVSDSLGTPIHARGIFHYSTALVEILRDIGFEITLVVEKSPGYGLERRTPRHRLSSQSLDYYQSAEIFRYFNDNIFSFPWRYENSRFQRVVDEFPLIIRYAQRIHERIRGRDRDLVNNASGRMDITPPKGQHLKEFDRFLYIDRFYSASMSRAANDLDPVGLSAAGYDLVIIDTPHYVRVKHIDRHRVFSVIHDMIPLNDPFFGQGWRQIFLSKMRATLALGGNLIFVSEYTKSLFHSVFPEHRPRHELVLHPSIPKDWMDRADPAHTKGRSAYIAAISRDRVVDRREHLRVRAARLAGRPEEEANLIKQFEATLPSWNGSLPYFATVTSDEPRKNIAVFCKISPKFWDKANFVIIGEVNGNAYMNHEPEMYPNLHFTGYLDDERKTDVIRHAAGVIFPSFSEGFGIPIVEGALFGRPVICSNLRVFHEVTRMQALYFDPNNPEELAARINELLANPATYAESARRLREIVLERFSQPVMQQRLQHILSEIGLPVRRPRGRHSVPAAEGSHGLGLVARGQHILARREAK